METNIHFEQSKFNSPNLEILWGLFRNPLDVLTRLAQTQGDIARVRLPKKDLFLLNHPEFIEQVLVKQQANYIKGPSLQRARIILGDGLLTSEGAEHLSQRRALQPAFHRQKMEEYLPVMNENTLQHISAWKHGEQINVSHEMMRLTLNIALWSFFGSAPDAVVERVEGAMSRLLRLFPLTFLPMPDYYQIFFPNFAKAKFELRIVTEQLLKNPDSVLGRKALINILKENTKDQFSGEQIHAHILTFLLAGHETTALLLTWCFEYLAHHPEVQIKIQRELDKVIDGEFSTSENIQNLVYTRMVLKETLRMRPPAWAISRQAVQDCTLGDYHIPAGSTVIMSQWVTHHDSRFYEDAHQFNPDRWLALEKSNFPRYAFYPFGGGNRICVGEHFAMIEAAAVISVVLRRWNLIPVQPGLVSPDPGITLRPKTNIKLKISQRLV